jgi:hypothetical protein
VSIEASQLDTEVLPPSSWGMPHLFAKTDKQLLALFTPEVERVLVHFRGGVGGDGVEQATGAL